MSGPARQASDRVDAAPAPENRGSAAGRPRLLVLLAALLPVLLAGAIFVQRSDRPIEQGGDAYSDGNAIIAGRNYLELGFVRTHFLPVVVPDPSRPDPAPDEYYTRYPPGADLVNGALRKLGIQRLEIWRLVSAAFSLGGLVFWFLGLRRLFGDGIAVAGVAAYALNFSFIWLGDSVHHYGYSDFLRSAAFYLGVRLSGTERRGLETLGLAVVLFAQSLLAFDYIPYSHVLLLGLGATGWKGERLRRLLILAAMPVLGVGLHLLQNAWALGLAESLSDMGAAFMQRALASGAGEFERPGLISMIRHLVWDTHQLMGLGLATIAGFAAFGVAAWGSTGPEGSRTTAARVVGAIAAATSVWFILMHQHAAEHPYSNRQLLPLASLAVALALHGVFVLAARIAKPLAWAVTLAAALGVAADLYLGYLNDDNRRAQVSRSFEVAYARRADVPVGATLATNIPAPSPPALSALLERRVRKVRNLSELEAAFGRGAQVVYLYSPVAPIDRPLLDLLRAGRILGADARGPLVEIVVPSAEPATP
ncbi:MAG: hypothetical protein ABIS67_14835 [Candidatus Eisenbacteria bacterium]